MPLCGGEPYDKGYGISCEKCGLWLGNGTRAIEHGGYKRVWNNRRTIMFVTIETNGATHIAVKDAEIDKLRKELAFVKQSLDDANERVQESMG